MLSCDQVEHLNDAIQAMTRDTVARQLKHFRASFPIDFTPEFYADQPLGRLKHILFGLCLHGQTMIDAETA